VGDPGLDAALARARAQCPDDEVGDLADALRDMVRDLRDTTVSRDALDAAHRALRDLNARLIDAQEQERARIARELHDDVVQRLAALALEQARVRQPADDEIRGTGLHALPDRLAALAEDVNGIARRLHPSTLDELGLDVAIDGECRGFFERGGPSVDVQAAGDWSNLARPARLALFRVVQESLRNVARHARAAHVRVQLRRAGDRVVLEVHDDGCGFDREAAGFRPGLGLSSMAERIHLLGGVFAVVSSPGQGTTIRAEVPA
jgi:signal transduction histidine kinase